MNKFMDYVLEESKKMNRGFDKTSAIVYLNATFGDRDATDVHWTEVINAVHNYTHDNQSNGKFVVMVFSALKDTIEQYGYKYDDAPGITEMIRPITEFCTSTSSAHLKGFDFEGENLVPYSFFLFHIAGLTKNHREAFGFLVGGMNKETHDFIANYIITLKGNQINSRGTTISKMLACAFAGEKLSSFTQFTDETFERQYKKLLTISPPKNSGTTYNNRYRYTGELINLYIYIQSHLSDKQLKRQFRVFTPAVWRYSHLIERLEEGYSIIAYDINADMPSADKWVIYSGGNLLRKEYAGDIVSYIDWSEIPDEFVRDTAKQCFWFDLNHVFNGRCKMYKLLISFAKRLRAANGKVQIKREDVLRYRSAVANIPPGQLNHILLIARYYIHYVESMHYADIDPVIFRILLPPAMDKSSYKEAFTDDEIKKLFDAYKLECDSADQDKHLNYLLYVLVLIIQANSSMRASTILNIRTNSLNVSLETGSTKEYTVAVYAKTNHNELTQYTITDYVHQLITYAMTLTADLRAALPENDENKDAVFIYRRNMKHKVICRVRAREVADWHKSVCEKYGIRPLREEAIRNYYAQAVSKYTKENNLGKAMVEQLMKHTADVHDRYYDDADIDDLCAEYYNVDIAGVKLEGHIAKEDTIPSSNRVADGCGKCTIEHCLKHGMIDCRICREFVTTIECIPFIEKDIEKIEALIMQSQTDHTIELYQSIKQLDVAYLARLYRLKEETNGKHNE